MCLRKGFSDRTRERNAIINQPLPRENRMRSCPAVVIQPNDCLRPALLRTVCNAMCCVGRCPMRFAYVPAQDGKKRMSVNDGTPS